MKRLLFILATLFILAPTVYADYALDEVYTELPDSLYTPPAVNFFSEPTIDEALYNLFETELLNAASNGALQKDIRIYFADIGVDFYTTDEVYNINYLLNIYSNVVYNHPEIGNLISGFTPYVESQGSTHLVLLVPSYRKIYNDEEYQALTTSADKAAYLARTHNIDAYNQAVKYAYSKAVSDDMTEDWQKLLSIHDYLVDTITYSPIISGDYGAGVLSAYNKYNDMLVFSPYGALVGDRIAVCQGYALAFKLLCDMAGIECGYALADNHIWNIVALGDNYYHIDATWDDPTSVKVSNGTESYRCTSPTVLHRHFLRSDTDSTAMHSSEGAWTTNMPECTDSELFGTLLDGYLNDEYNRLNTCLRWADGSFWFELYTYKLDSLSGRLYYIPSGTFYHITSNGLETVSQDEYLPAKRLDAQMYNISDASDNSYIAIDGKANSTADFYAAKYTENDVLTDVYKADITFNEYGEEVAEFPKDYDRLFLFTDGSMKPVAYSK